MTRLKNYIKEELNWRRIAEIIKKDCKPYLKEIGNLSLYRGMFAENRPFVKKISRTDRKPKDSSLVSHKIMDNIFKKKYGWKARSEGVFVTGDRSITHAYGITYIYFPIGKYKYLWSPNIHDLGTEIVSDRIKLITDNYTNKNLKLAAKSNNEIIFKVKEYYVVDENYYRKLYKELI